ncbi:ALI_collapsed_G0006450.mRNA.1.CDS.1 [Saccharomyces cerevisiae]|nr:ALI_collapsed_G0006450.mRNA.1.CDS.1 [Saccharomyces cerevisiae]
MKISSDLSSNKTVLGNAQKVQESPSGPLIYVLPQSSTKHEKEGSFERNKKTSPFGFLLAKLTLLI